MARVNLKSNNTAVIIGESPSFKTTNETGTLFMGVQSASFSVDVQREVVKQVGSCYYAVDDLPRQPEADLTISYLFSPNMINEKNLGMNLNEQFIGSPPLATTGSFVSGLETYSNNFYFYNHPDQGSDAIEYLTSTDINTPNSGEIISFGNCYLTEYALSFDIGELPVVSTSYKCSNMKAELYTGNIKMPSINLLSGNNFNVGDLDFANLVYNLQDYLGLGIDLDLSKPENIQPGNVILNLEDLQVGGQSLIESKHIINSFSFSFATERVDLYGLGSDYVMGRKMPFPVRGAINLSSSVSKYEPGFISGLLKNESTYDIKVEVENCDKTVASVMEFDDVKLENFQYSIDVNGEMEYNASFSFKMYNK